MEYESDNKRYRLTPPEPMAEQASSAAGDVAPPPPPTSAPLQTKIPPRGETAENTLPQENAAADSAVDVASAASPTNALFAEDLQKGLEELSSVGDPSKLASALASAWHSECMETQNIAFMGTLQLLASVRSWQLQNCVAELLFLVRRAVKYALRKDISSSEKYVERLLPPLQRITQDVSGSDPSELTALDTEFLRLCVEADMYTSAKPVVDRRIFRLKKDFCDSVDVCIEYFYFAGLIRSEQQAYKQAFYSFDQGLSFPCMTREAQSIQRNTFSSTNFDTAGGRLLPQKALRPYIVKLPQMLLHLKEQLQQSQELLQHRRGWKLACATVEALELRVLQSFGSRFNNVSLHSLQHRLGFPSLAAAQLFIYHMQEKGACVFDEKTFRVSFKTPLSGPFFSIDSGRKTHLLGCQKKDMSQELQMKKISRGRGDLVNKGEGSRRSSTKRRDMLSGTAIEEGIQKEEHKQQYERRLDSVDTDESVDVTDIYSGSKKVPRKSGEKRGAKSSQIENRKCSPTDRMRMTLRVHAIIQKLVDAVRELELAQESLHAV